MGNRLAMVLLLAIAVPAAACLLLYKVLVNRAPRHEATQTARLLVAAHDLPTGTLLKENDFREVDWKGAPPHHALTEARQVVNRGVASMMIEGEPLVEERLAPVGAGAGLAATIPVGMRAVAVRVNDVVGVSGFATPGMKVDVLILGVSPGANAMQGTQVRTLLQNIRVLSAGQEIQKTEEGKPLPVQVVNVLVTPTQAEILSLASNDARVQLVLRNPVDMDVAATPGTAMNEIFGPRGAPSPEASAGRGGVRRAHVAIAAAPLLPPEIDVEVIHGTKREVERFNVHPPKPAPALPAAPDPTSTLARVAEATRREGTR